MTKSIAKPLLASLVLMATPAVAESSKAVCNIVASSIGGKRFAVLKCHKETDINFKIRRTVWENEDPEAFRDMASQAGRKFTCTLARSGSELIADAMYHQYRLSDCR